jgi:hypothetical protein
MLLFKRMFVEDVLSGRKTQTRRLHRSLRKVGSIQDCRCNFTGSPFCKVLITRVFQQMLCDISEVDARKEGFKSRSEFFEAFKQFGGNHSTVVTVYEFQVYT